MIELYKKKIIMMNITNYQMLKKNKYNQKFNPKNLKCEEYNYDGWFKEDEFDDEEDLYDILSTEDGEEEVNKGKR